MGAAKTGEGKAENSAKRTSSSPSITPAQFLSWKLRKDAEASARKAEAARKREEDIRAGNVQMNGRELFLHEPEKKLIMTTDHASSSKASAYLAAKVYMGRVINQHNLDLSLCTGNCNEDKSRLL